MICAVLCCRFIEMSRNVVQVMEGYLLINFDFAFNSLSNGQVRNDPLHISHLPDVNPELRRHIEHLKQQPKAERRGKQYDHFRTSTGAQRRHPSPPSIELQRAVEALQILKQQEFYWAANYEQSRCLLGQQGSEWGSLQLFIVPIQLRSVSSFLQIVLLFG